MNDQIKNYLDFVKKRENTPIIVLCFVLLFGYILPTLVYIDLPYGTDAFTHLIYTDLMAKTNSLNEFYEKNLENGYIGYDYPFGLWMFGSIVAKITGVELLQLSLLIPFGCFAILILLYYQYSELFNQSKEVRIFSILFLLSIPSIVMSVLGYSTSIFAMFVDVAILYLLLNESMDVARRFILINIFVFFLCITHTGTYLFIIFLSMTMFVVFAAISGKLHKESYFLALLTLLYYTALMHIFPHIHSQYIGKGRILLSIGEFMSIGSVSMRQVLEMFYERLLVSLSVPFIVFWMSFLFLIGYLTTWINHYILKAIRNSRSGTYQALLPAGAISHGPAFWPLWLGPVNVILAVIGVLRIRKILILSLVISVTIITLPSGVFAGERALRELFYMFLVIPPLSAIGFVAIRKYLSKMKKSTLRSSFAVAAYLIIFLSITSIPVVGNLYYHQDISGSKHEIDGMKWLASVGTSGEGAIGPLGSRLAVYANKIPVKILSVTAGSEMSRLAKDEYYTYFRSQSEDRTKDLLASFGINYLVSTDKIFRIYGQSPSNLSVDSNTQLDKIYSSKSFFAIYRQIPSKYRIAQIFPQINFDDEVLIKDAGGSFLIDTNYYRIRLSKETPEIQYIGTRLNNYLGEGGFADILKLVLLSPDRKEVVYGLHELSYSEITIGKNQIIYTTTIKTGSGQKMATISVKYTFFERAFKKEIFVANDWSNSSMRVGYTAKIYSPLDMFKIKYGENVEKRKLYPNEDYVLLEDTKFSEMFIHHNGTGILIKYTQSAPYPNKILYTGSVTGYYMVNQIMDTFQNELSPSESIVISQWISTGDEESAEKNIDRYSLSIYPFPYAIKPLILISYLGDVNNITNDKLTIVKNVHKYFEQHSIPHYFEVVDINSDLDVLSGITKDIIYTSETQELPGGIEVRGYYPKYLKCDLKLVESLEKSDAIFVFSKEVPAPFNVYWREGVRLPHSAYIKEKETNILHVPVSKPTIKKEGTYPDFKGMINVIDSSANYDSLVVFRWDSVYLNSSEIREMALKILDYAKRRGLTISDPYEIADHLLLLRNISISVSINDSSGVIEANITNKNNKPINGVTLRIDHPSEPKVENAQIIKREKNKWYITTDIMAGKSKTVKIFV
ncbi:MULTISPECIES: hypothetical protein [unclassified Archaeoglobus]|jgi:hypothetical protein|uniref:hypothetical protein n=1 Tax=unclassified Archaeoglobus TaxID=2643606 RepID=UPI0025C09733|nr:MULTISPECIES: hypothetical protein [unclassified Archaeoglobus]